MLGYVPFLASLVFTDEVGCFATFETNICMYETVLKSGPRQNLRGVPLSVHIWQSDSTGLPVGLGLYNRDGSDAVWVLFFHRATGHLRVYNQSHACVGLPVR
jgi:hypothetical protein